MRLNIGCLAMAALLSSVAVADSDNECLSLGDLTDNDDGTVTDADAGLMWSMCPLNMTWTDGDCVGEDEDEQGYLSWSLALNYASELVLGDYSDWRLPNINELRTLVERNCSSFAINDAVIWIDTDNYVVKYWSSTTYVSSPDTARVVDFQSGGEEAVSKGEYDYTAVARAVRDID